MKQQREIGMTVGADRKRIPLGTPIIVSTYTVRTLYQAEKFHQLVCSGIDAGVNIIGVQEHRLDSINLKIKIGFSFITLLLKVVSVELVYSSRKILLSVFLAQSASQLPLMGTFQLLSQLYVFQPSHLKMAIKTASMTTSLTILLATSNVMTSILSLVTSMRDYGKKVIKLLQTSSEAHFCIV